MLTIMALMCYICFSYISTVRSLAKNHFLLDIHIPELLAFGAGTDLHDHVLYKSGEIIFQDKVIWCLQM